MKKAIAVALSLGLLVGALVAPAEAGKKKRKPKKVTREVEGSYDLPPLVLVGTCSQTGAIGCVTFLSGPKEKFVTAKITDQHGQPVAVSVSANLDGEIGDDETYGTFCGETEEPIAIPPSTELHFWVGAATDVGTGGCVPGAATSGTATATFSNLP